MVSSHLPTLVSCTNHVTGDCLDKLVDLYELPHSRNMFFYERKLLYLKFIGASRELMRLILD